MYRFSLYICREKRGSTRYGVAGKGGCLLTPRCATLARGYQHKSRYEEVKLQYK